MTTPYKHLLVLLNGDHIGDLTQDRHGQMAFTYDEAWRRRPDATPLSLSMPLSRGEHGNVTVDAYLRGLLPDNENVLRRWGRRFNVSPNSPFALLSNVGEDVAGAAQFIKPDRLDAATAPGELDYVDDAYIADRLRVLRGDRAAWDDIRSPGMFSLAGAQAKFALYQGPDGRWAIPTGRKATTHIFKPPLEHLAHQEVNEHLCLRAASLLGMRTALSAVETFGDEQAIVLGRYDRVVRGDGDVTRIHQEDVCQALAVPPDRKYERTDGGPGAPEILGLFERHMDPQIAHDASEQFVRALAFNWVIYGPDAHAKNYSLLLDVDQVVLAPLYDISSVAPYPDRYELRDMMTAMSVNRQFQNSLVTGVDWVAMAESVRLDPDEVLDWVDETVERAPDAFADAIASQEQWIRDLPMTGELLDQVANSSAARRRFLITDATPRRSIDAGIEAIARAQEQRPAGKPNVTPYRRADGTYVKGYPNPRYRGR